MKRTTFLSTSRVAIYDFTHFNNLDPNNPIKIYKNGEKEDEKID